MANYEQNQQTFTAILILSTVAADDLDSTLPRVILQKSMQPLGLNLDHKTEKNKAVKPNRKLLTKWDHLLSEDVEQEVLYK